MNIHSAVDRLSDVIEELDGINRDTCDLRHKGKILVESDCFKDRGILNGPLVVCIQT